MPDCSRCGENIEATGGVCPSCGTPAPQATASFEPVATEEGALAQAPHPDEGPVLIVRKGPQPGEMFYLDSPSLTVGRDPGSDIFLNDMTVSRAHAVLATTLEGVSVRDAGSLNGTYVNGACVDQAELREGDVLQIGTFQMVFHGGAGGR